MHGMSNLRTVLTYLFMMSVLFSLEVNSELMPVCDRFPKGVYLPSQTGPWLAGWPVGWLRGKSDKANNNIEEIR